MGSIHHLHLLNHWALLVSALVLWILGALWYSPPLFAKPWAAMLGLSMSGPKTGLAAGMIASFVGDLILSLVLLHFVHWSGADTFLSGAFIGFLCWIGFIAAPSLPQNIYERRPFGIFAINTGYWLVGLIGVGGMLAIWR